MKLIGIEIRRLLSRRLLRGLTILAMFGLVLGGTIAFLTSHPDPEAQGVDRDQIESCMEDLDDKGVDLSPEDMETICTGISARDPGFVYTQLVDLAAGISFPLLMLGWLLGASAMGADWNSRMITTLLTWEPRRIRLFLSRTIAIGTVVFLWVVFLQLFLAAVMYPAAAFRGTTFGVDGEWFATMLRLIARSGGVAALASLLGMSIASVGKNTAAAFGVGFFYLAIAENLVRGLKPNWAGWLLGDNIAAVILPSEDVILSHSNVEAAGLLLIYLVVIVALAAGIFRRREIA